MRWLRYYWFILSDLSDRLDIDRYRLHEAFKKGYGIKSIYEADKDYINELMAFVVQEFGIILPEPGDPPSRELEKMSFKKFIDVRIQQRDKDRKKKFNKSLGDADGVNGKKR